MPNVFLGSSETLQSVGTTTSKG